MDEKSFVVTREWICQHRQCSGGWTPQQLEALGISSPTPNGWLDSVVGTEISADQVRRFESQSPVNTTRHVLVSKPLRSVGTEHGLVGPVNGSYSTEGGGRSPLIPRRAYKFRGRRALPKKDRFRHFITFGRYRGRLWESVPKKYLEWLFANTTNPRIKSRCNVAINRIEKQQKRASKVS